MMREVARLFEAGIRAHPRDWHMLQRVFVADLDPGRMRRAAVSWPAFEARTQAGNGRRPPFGAG